MMARDRVSQILSDLDALRTNRTLFLLDEPTVQEALTLTDEQQSRLVSLLRRDKTSPHERKSNPDPTSMGNHEQQIVEQARANEAAVAETLSTTQFRRLKQIALQVEGPMAFRNQDVVVSLGLTADQRQQIRRILDERAGGRNSRFGHNPPSESQLDTILDNLTVNQLKIWHELIGEPFAGVQNVRSFNRPGPQRFEPRR